MKKNIVISVLFMLFASTTFCQMYTQKDIINTYDPWTLTLNDMTINTNDEDYKEHMQLIVITISVGNEKIIKFLYPDDMLINSVKIGDEIMTLNYSVRRNNTILIPASAMLPNKPNNVTIKFEGYSSITDLDRQTLSSLATSFCYTSSSMYYEMDRAFKFLSNSPDVNRPNNNLLATAEVVQQNVSKRTGVFYMGLPVQSDFAVPQDPKKVVGTNLLMQGKKQMVNNTSLKAVDTWNYTITKFTDVKMVQNEPYYTKIKGVFTDISGMQKVPVDKREGTLMKVHSVVEDDLVPGRKVDVYMNDQVVKQFSNLMYLLKAGIRAKSDSLETTSESMRSDEREALSFIENNIKENDFNLDNQYIYDDYISSSVNRGALLKEIDLIRKYYGIK